VERFCQSSTHYVFQNHLKRAGKVRETPTTGFCAARIRISSDGLAARKVFCGFWQCPGQPITVIGWLPLMVKKPVAADLGSRCLIRRSFQLEHTRVSTRFCIPWYWVWHFFTLTLHVSILSHTQQRRVPSLLLSHLPCKARGERDFISGKNAILQ